MAGRPKKPSEILRSVDSTAGRQRLAVFLKRRPYPHFEQADSKGLLLKIDADGKRTLGRFVNRQFQAIEKP